MFDVHGGLDALGAEVGHLLHDVLDVAFGGFLHLVAVLLEQWARVGGVPAQRLEQQVLTQRVGLGTLGSETAGGVRHILAQPRRARAVEPPFATGGGQERVLIRHRRHPRFQGPEPP